MFKPVVPILPGIPLLPVLAAFVAGVASVRFIDGLIAYEAALLAALCLVAWAFKKFRIAILSLFALIGVVAASLAVAPRLNFDDAETDSRYVGRVERVVVSPYGQRMVVGMVAENRDCRALVYFHSSLPVARPGDVVEFCGVLRPVDDGVAVPGEFSLREYAWRNGISACCHVSAGGLRVVGFRDSPGAFFARAREGLSYFIYARSGLSPSAAAMLDAVLTGNAGELDAGVREDFATSGTAHVLALSGTHVAVIAFMVSLLFFPLRMAGHELAKSICVLVALWCYVLLTGCSPSVVRAVIMASVVIMGTLLRRGSVPVNNLCLAALLILLFDPMALYAPGFRLSFVAVAGILLFAFGLMPGGRLPVGVRPALQWVAVCCAAVVATTPLAAWHFHQVPAYFLLANLPVGLAMPWFMGGGVLLLVLQWAGIGAGWLVAGEEWLYGVMEWFVSRVAGLPGAAVDGIYFPWWVLVPCYAALLALWRALQCRRAVFAWRGVLLLVFAAGCMLFARPRFPAVEAYGIRYHYATALLLREGGTCKVLTDAPPKFHPEMRCKLERRLADFMGMRGIDSLEVVSALAGSRAFYAGKGCWVVGNRLIVLAGAGGAGALPDDGLPRPAYALVTRGFKGDVTALSADTIVLSRALHDSRRNELCRELEASGRVFRVGLEGNLLR